MAATSGERELVRSKIVQDFNKWLQETYGVCPNSQQLFAIKQMIGPLV